MRSCSARLVLCLALSAAASARAATVKVTPDHDRYPLLAAAELLEDPSAALTIDEVARAPWADRFAPLRPEQHNIGFSRSAFFLRLTLVGDGDAPARWYLAPSRALDDVRLNTPRADGAGFV